MWRSFQFAERAVRGWRSRPTGWGEQPEDVEWLDRKYQAQMVESVQEFENQLPDDSAINRQVSNYSMKMDFKRWMLQISPSFSPILFFVSIGFFFFF